MDQAFLKNISESSLADSWPGCLLLFLLFLFCLAALLGYGDFLAQGRKGTALDRLSDAFLFGSLVAFLSAFAAGTLNLYSWLSGAPSWILLVPGFLRSLSLIRAVLSVARRRVPLAFAALAFVFLVRALGAAIPSQHGDPLLYHLLGPRLWVSGGGFLMHADLPNALLASSWECLYVWPQLLWTSAIPLFGLVEAQIFSQWLHLFVAWGGSAVLLMQLFRGWISPRLLPFTALAGLFVAGVQWTAPLAKNDVGISFWVLGALALFLRGLREASPARLIAAGLFSGLAISGKVTAVLSLGPIGGAAAFFAFRHVGTAPCLRAVFLGACGAMAGLSPIYLRNYFLSANPFFPMFSAWFPSPWISQSWGAHFAQVQPAASVSALARLWTRIPDLWRESPWIFVLLPAVPAMRRRFPVSEAGAALPAVLGASFGAYLIFILTQSADIELRYLGAALMLLASGGFALFARYMGGWFPAGSRQALLAGVIGIGLLFAGSKLPVHLLWKIWRSPLGTEFLRKHTGGEAKAWIRANAGNSLTILAGDNETYYLTTAPVTVLTERPDLDAVRGIPELSRFVREICRLSGARYLLEARPEIGLAARYGAEALLPAKVFSAQGASIYRLTLLEPGPEKFCK